MLQTTLASAVSSTSTSNGNENYLNVQQQFKPILSANNSSSEVLVAKNELLNNMKQESNDIQRVAVVENSNRVLKRKKMRIKGNDDSDQEDGHGVEDQEEASEDDDEVENRHQTQLKKLMNSHEASSIRTPNYSASSHKPNLSVESAYNQHQYGSSYLESSSIGALSQPNVHSQAYGWMKDAQSGYYSQSLNLNLPISTVHANKYNSQLANMSNGHQIQHGLGLMNVNAQKSIGIESSTANVISSGSGISSTSSKSSNSDSFHATTGSKSSKKIIFDL
jgi:hypothetical protein